MYKPRQCLKWSALACIAARDVSTDNQSIKEEDSLDRFVARLEIIGAAVGISRLRALNVTQLRELDKTLVIQDNDKPLAVLLKYEHFLAMQEKILKCEGE
ncbi:MAG: hypothetical protein WB660_05660 [Candidatus Sulfotelmatobacter sp.]